MTSTVGGSTSTKDRRRMSSFDELPGHNCLRSEQTLVRNCEGVNSKPRDCVQKYLSKKAVCDCL